MNKKTLAIILLLIGILSVIFSFAVFGMNTGYYESDKLYGGDAYTGIQNAAAQSANNLIYVAEIIRASNGYILLIGGLSLITTALMKLSEAIKEAKEIVPKANVVEPQPSDTNAITEEEFNTKKAELLK